MNIQEIVEGTLIYGDDMYENDDITLLIERINKING